MTVLHILLKSIFTKGVIILALLPLIILIHPLRGQVQVTTEEWYNTSYSYNFTLNQASMGDKVMTGDKVKPNNNLSGDIDLGSDFRIPSVGISPRGYGKVHFWDRKEEQITLIAYINPADPLGVAVTNLQPGDIVEITSATGIASFSDGHGRLISSLIGAAAIAGGALAPEAYPFIRAGEEFAKANFSRGNRGKQRDPFGLDERGKYQKCEGGVLISLPSAGGVYYSTEGCLKEKLPRYDDVKPDHVEYGFFLVRPKNGSDENWRRVAIAGEMYMLAWDRKFTDNQGYYMVMLRITQGDS